jgi:hypothetical protein
LTIQSRSGGFTLKTLTMENKYTVENEFVKRDGKFLVCPHRTAAVGADQLGKPLFINQRCSHPCIHLIETESQITCTCGGQKLTFEKSPPTPGLKVI